jgi:hypothetical protein
MKTSTIVFAAIVFSTMLGAMGAAPSPDQPVASGKIRVGTYDNRAIAVAYAASSFNPVSAKMKEYDAAKQAGDKKKIEELEAWGKAHQRMLHFQGFGRVPVQDLLKPVKDGVAKIATEQKLAAIAMECDFTSSDVEVVDVTDQLIELFKPSDKTRTTARKMRSVQPESLLVLADMRAED